MKSPQKPGNDVTILLIDQLSELQAHISGCLRDEGYHVHIECEAEPGLRFWEENHPEVVICDVASPEIDGLSILSEITASEYSTQVIMISDAGEMDDVVKALRQISDAIRLRLAIYFERQGQS